MRGAGIALTPFGGDELEGKELIAIFNLD